MCVFYFFLYCPHGIIYPLTGQYLTSIGFTGTQVGIVTSLGTASAIFAGMYWGQLYANSRHKRMVIALMFLAAAALSVLSIQTRVFLIYIILYGGIFFFMGPVHGLCDSLLLGRGGNFSMIRSFGAFGYSAAVFTAGKLAAAAGMDKVFYIFSAAFLIAVPFILTEPEPPHYQETNGEKIKAGLLLKNPAFLKFMLINFFIQGTCMAQGTYFGYLIQEGGGEISRIGTIFMLMTLAEGGFMLLLPYLNKIFSRERLIFAAIFISTVRFIFYATGPSSGLLFATCFIQGIINGTLMVELVKQADSLVETRYSSVAVSIYYACNSLSGIVCNFLGGVLLDAVGTQGIYVFFSLFNVAALVLCILFGYMKKAS